MCFINAFQVGRRGPQGLKPAIFLVLNGTAEAVPYPQPIYETRSKLLLLIALILLGNSLLLAADRGTLVREAVIYLSPDTTSSKLAQVERGRELILLDKSHNWLHVEALLGSAKTLDPAFVLEDEDEGKTISGWVLDTGAVWASTPNGDRILFGAAVDSEDEASRRHGRRGAAQDALRLYRRVLDYVPAASPPPPPADHPRPPCASIAASTISSRPLPWPAKPSTAPPTFDGRSRNRTCSPAPPRARKIPTFAKASTSSP